MRDTRQGVVDRFRIVTALFSVLGLGVGAGCIPPNDLAPHDLTYSDNPAIYIAGTAIPPNTPSCMNGAMAVYSVSPTLPTGLRLETATGVISGIPTAVTSTSNHVVTAANVAGHAEVSLSITVTPPALFISVQPADQAVLAGAEATFSVAAIGFGSLTYQWLRNGKPIPDATNTAYTTSPVTPFNDGDSFSAMVSDSYGSSVTSNTATLSVHTNWSNTGSLTQRRAYHSATLLPNGKVLIAGGENGARVSGFFPLASAELYDPSSGAFADTGRMKAERAGHHARLLSNGKVLIVGGRSAGSGSCMELYDPSTEAFTDFGDCIGMATVLSDGKVLFLRTGVSSTLYDPVTETFSSTGTMNITQSSYTATLLRNGKVLITDGDIAELYDPSTGVFTVTGSMNTSRSGATATLLSNGKVLFAGGDDRQSKLVSGAELYDPESGVFTITGSMVVARHGHRATLLSDGTVLFTGGDGIKEGAYSKRLHEAELYDPVSGTFAATSSMNTERDSHTATLLIDGKLLVVGGYGGFPPSPNSMGCPTPSAELYR